MIRVLFRSALPLLSLGVAAAFLGGDIVASPGGEPLVVAMPGEARLQQARFDGAECPATLLFADRGSAADPDGGVPGTRIIGFALRTTGDGIAVGVEDFPGGAETARETVFLFFDDGGRLVAAGPSEELLTPAEMGGCLPTPDHGEPGPV